MLGDFTVRARAEEDTTKVGPVDVVIVAVKAYDNANALPLLAPMLGSVSSVLTLQNGVDSVQEVAVLVGEGPVIGGTTYVATALSSPGVIEQTGTHRRIVFGEVFGPCRERRRASARSTTRLPSADIQSEPVDDGRMPIWEKFIFLAALAGFTGASRLPIGPVWADPDVRARFLDAAVKSRVWPVRKACNVASDVVERMNSYVAASRARCAPRSSSTWRRANASRLRRCRDRWCVALHAQAFRCRSCRHCMRC